MRLSVKDSSNNIRFANSFLCNNKKRPHHKINVQCNLHTVEFIIHESIELSIELCGTAYEKKYTYVYANGASEIF